MEETSRQDNNQAVVWLLLDAFTQICGENPEQKDKNTMKFGERRNAIIFKAVQKARLEEA